MMSQDPTLEPEPDETREDVESLSEVSTDPDECLMNESLAVEYDELGYECRTGGGSIRSW